MKNLLIYLFLIIPLAVTGQSKLITKNGQIVFEASVPAFEEVKAKNEAVTCIINTSNGEIASLALMKGFRFKIALMEEHFNENYVESDKYPKATFSGKIQNFDFSKVTATEKEYTIKGKISIHGKTKNIEIKSTINKADKGLNLKSNFVLNPNDFDIEIPSIVSNKVAKTVDVSLDFELK
jgi:hypothetical protein